MNHYPSWTSLTSLQISINLNNWGTEQKVKLSDHHFTSFQFYGGWKATFSLTAKDPRKLVIAYISFLGWPIQTSLIWSKTVPKKTCYKTWQEKLKEAEQDEAILTFRRYAIRLVSKVSSSVNSQRKGPKKSGEREGKIALKALKKELQKSHRRKAVRTEEARARRRRSRKSETHLFRRTSQRIEVTIKENFKRKRNLSDQLNNKDDENYSYPARETNNFEEEEQARMHRRSNKARLPEHKTTQHAPEKAYTHTSTEGQDEWTFLETESQDQNLSAFFNQFCDIAKVAIIHMKIYSNSAIAKMWKWN